MITATFYFATEEESVSISKKIDSVNSTSHNLYVSFFVTLAVIYVWKRLENMHFAFQIYLKDLDIKSLPANDNVRKVARDLQLTLKLKVHFSYPEDFCALRCKKAITEPL